MLRTLNKQFGFTLIELMVVMAIIGTLAAATSVVFGNFRQTQTLNIAYDNLNTALAEAKSNALSQVVINCEDDSTEALLGYELSFETSLTYSLVEVCEVGGVEIPHTLRTTTLPSGVTFIGTPAPIRFLVLNGGSGSPDTEIRISNDSSGDSKGIRVTTSGVIQNAD